MIQTGSKYTGGTNVRLGYYCALKHEKDWFLADAEDCKQANRKRNDSDGIIIRNTVAYCCFSG